MGGVAIEVIKDGAGDDAGANIPEVDLYLLTGPEVDGDILGGGVGVAAGQGLFDPVGAGGDVTEVVTPFAVCGGGRDGGATGVLQGDGDAIEPPFGAILGGVAILVQVDGAGDAAFAKVGKVNGLGGAAGDDHPGDGVGGVAGKAAGLGLGDAVGTIGEEVKGVATIHIGVADVAIAEGEFDSTNTCLVAVLDPILIEVVEDGSGDFVGCSGTGHYHWGGVRLDPTRIIRKNLSIAAEV